MAVRSTDWHRVQRANALAPDPPRFNPSPKSLTQTYRKSTLTCVKMDRVFLTHVGMSLPVRVSLPVIGWIWGKSPWAGSGVYRLHLTRKLICHCGPFFFFFFFFSFVSAENLCLGVLDRSRLVTDTMPTGSMLGEITVWLVCRILQTWLLFYSVYTVSAWGNWRSSQFKVL